MGYYSSHFIDVDDASITMTEAIEKAIEELDGGYGLNYVNLGWNSFNDGESSKWYEFESDLRSLSSQFPTVYFYGERRGEENGDIEYYKAHNGKMERYNVRDHLPTLHDIFPKDR